MNIDVFKSIVSFFVSIFFDLLQKAFFANKEPDDEFYEHKHSYCETRNTIISQIFVYATRRKEMELEKKLHLSSLLSQADHNLFDYIERLLNNYSSNELYDYSYQRNYPRNARIKFTADSRSGKWGHPYYAGDYRKGAWVSEINNINWLMVDLLKAQPICKVVIQHYDESDLITKDFQVLGSLDNERWILLDNVVQNYHYKTEHCFTETYLRYIKIIITDPGSDQHARITNLSVLGRKQ